ncbi:MAG: DUF2804 domain-containing protein [Clostridia bacterium]|nr:DUF2804 domain-containing protein [Clostridia bacterium]
MQHKVKKWVPLLNEDGNLIEPGYATTMLFDYDRSDIRANKLRIKEWDYYLIYNKEFALALTIADNSYMGLISASVINLKVGKETTKSAMKIMPMGKTNMPRTSKVGQTMATTSKVGMCFDNNGRTRHIVFEYQNFENGKPLVGDIMLTNEPEESMVIATPFTKDKHFYLNQKIVGFKAMGYFKIGDKEVQFYPKETRALLDWGRGVWTYKNTWYWGCACGTLGDNEFGFNIGAGFGDTSQATENMIFFNGKAHKLDIVTFNIPKTDKQKDNFMGTWTLGSTDGRFNMKFRPIIDRHANMNLGILSSNQHQVFGKFTGFVVLDDGTKIHIKNFLGFVEKVINKW